MAAKDEFDLVVLGGGSAGYAAARTFHAGGGGTVAVVDGARELGGLCILRGCMPSKTLLASAEVLQRAREAERFGLRVEGARADLDLLRARKRRLIDDFAGYRQGQLQDGRFTLFRNRGVLADPHTLVLDDGRRVRFRYLLLATGSSIATPPVPGLAETPHWTSDDVLDLPALPASVITLGGGVVATELTQFLARMGAKATLVQRSPRILKEHTPEASAALAGAFAGEGIEVVAGTTIEHVGVDPAGGVVVRFRHGGELLERRAEHLFQALGRVPATRGIGLAEAGVAVLPSGHVRTDAAQRSTRAHIFAAGDCAGPLEIVHVAIQQGEIAAKTMLGQHPAPVDHERQLSVVFTDPGVAHVGLSPAALAARRDLASASYPFADHGKSLVLEAPHGFVRVWAQRGGGRLVAAECVGRDAGELIHPLAVGITLGATAADLLRAPWYHPTLAEIWTYPLEDLA